ncbi:creatininase family protein [Actinoplanes sp. NPDC051346]|uniref:creatininase family protein n=1 Tax=Actinoplanes sp. NPDC051346 TaxID=3155048 RepID=UPI0034143678
MTTGHRQLSRLPATEIHAKLSASSVLCLPIGSHEQHGPHLPLNTDAVIAEQFTRRLIDRYGDSHDLWMLPAIPYGLSLEHAWSPGTVSLQLRVFADLLDDICGQYCLVTPARSVAIINGHGGNRGVLEAAVYELRHRHDLRLCVIHPTSLTTIGKNDDVPDIHAGLRETAVMLAVAPDDVHLDCLPEDHEPRPQLSELARQAVYDRGVTWPWTSQDEMASNGVIGGNPHHGTADLGERILLAALDRCDSILRRLTEPMP